MFYQDIKIFYDGVNIKEFKNVDYIKGYTTNPTLMNKGKIQSNNYKDFAIEFLKCTKELPVSFEVFADDLDEMITQAKEIYSWCENKSIYVKIKSRCPSENNNKILASINQSQKTKEETITSSIEKNKDICKSMGFNDETESMANCILQLILNENKNTNQQVVISNDNSSSDTLAQSTAEQNRIMQEQTRIMERQLRIQRQRNIREAMKSFQKAIGYDSFGNKIN